MKTTDKSNLEDHIASVQIVADLCGETTEVVIGKPSEYDRYGVVQLNGILGKYKLLQKLAQAAAKPRTYPCDLKVDLKEIASRFTEEELGAAWSVTERIPSCPMAGYYRPRKPGDPPCESFRLQFEGTPEPFVTVKCGGQPDPRPTRPGEQARPPVPRSLTLAFVVNVSLAKKP
jgi:hypothetical protein